MSGGEIAGLIAAGAFLLLVGVIAIPLIKLGSVLQAAEEMVRGVTDKTIPLLGEVTTTVVHTNVELERVDAITANVQSITTNAKAMSEVFAATLGGPLVKVAAFSYGVRRAAGDKRRGEVEKVVKAEMKAERKAKHRSGSEL